MVMSLCGLVCFLQMRDKVGNPVGDISSLAGLAQSRIWLAAAFAIVIFRLAGIPSLFGFWAKFLVLDAAVGAGLSELAAIGIAASVISAFYYLKIVKTIYIDDPAPEYARAGSVVENGIITICAAIIVLGYLLNPVLDSATAAAAQALF